MIGADKMPILLPSLCSKVQPPRFQNQETKLMKRGQIPTSADALIKYRAKKNTMEAFLKIEGQTELLESHS